MGKASKRLYRSHKIQYERIKYDSQKVNKGSVWAGDGCQYAGWDTVFINGGEGRAGVCQYGDVDEW